MTARHTLQSVFTPGEFRLQAEEKEHLRKRKRDHGKIDALTADRKEADHKPHQGRADNAKQYSRLGWEVPFLNGIGREIGRAAEKGRMAE